ncbi:hypothetical protein F5Y08DRAFT_125071 [Xylaria arbuscula]|nr:hypothetical protein F5Y08DRAFT_125071 [Xylaria arbuscula]
MFYYIYAPIIMCLYITSVALRRAPVLSPRHPGTYSSSPIYPIYPALNSTGVAGAGLHYRVTKKMTSRDVSNGFPDAMSYASCHVKI